MKYTSKLILNGEEYQFAAPSGGRYPSEHTMLYIPMDTTYGTTDQSQYHRTYTVSGLTHTTYSGVDCYQNSNGYIDLGISAYSWLVPSSLEATYSFWVNIPSVSNYNTIFGGAVQNEFWYSIHWLNNKIGIDGGKPSQTLWSAYGTQAYANGWHLFIGTITGGRDYLYIDGNLVADNTSYSLSQIPNNGFGAWHINSQQGIHICTARGTGDAWTGYLGQIVFEDKAWTEQEISDYFNQTKSLYGIS